MVFGVCKTGLSLRVNHDNPSNVKVVCFFFFSVGVALMVPSQWAFSLSVLAKRRLSLTSETEFRYNKILIRNMIHG